MMAAILNSPLPNDPFMDGYNMGQRDAEVVIDRLRLEVKAMSHELDRLRAEKAELLIALESFSKTDDAEFDRIRDERAELIAERDAIESATIEQCDQVARQYGLHNLKAAITLAKANETEGK